MSYFQEIIPSTQANPTQMAMAERGYGMFIHFGVNTFGETEWSDGSILVEAYTPTLLDCDQWVRVAHDAGFRYVLLTVKHHDGFCLWNSRFTDYDVASSPVKTDVMAEVAKAYKKYGLQFAIYYSLWDRKEPSYKDKNPEIYIDYMCNQLTELLTNYGQICELWFDGGWDRKVEDWHLDRVYKHVKKIQPLCAVGVNHTIELKEGSRKFALPDSMIVDNKCYFQYFPSDFRLWDPKVAHEEDKKQYIHQGKSYYVPFEHTICISKTWAWFNKCEPQPTRDLDELEELFYWCTDKQNTLVVNIPPDSTGRIRDHEANAIIELGRRLGIQQGKTLSRNGVFHSLNAPAKASSVHEGNTDLYGASYAVDGGMQTSWVTADTTASLTIELDPMKSFNKVTIFEYQDEHYAADGFTCTRTNSIESYLIDIYWQNEWKNIYVGDESMGIAKLSVFHNLTEL